LKQASANFRILVEKEALGRESKRGSLDQPSYIRSLKHFGIDWEEMSDQGHMHYGPEGTIMFDLICDYVNQVVSSVGIPVYRVRGTNMFNLEDKAIQEHANLFGQRMYKVEVDGKSYVMRYAACFQQFALAKDWKISYRNLPFGEFEIADSYRLEQSGELTLGFRLRRLNMPDLHVFCKDTEEAKGIFKQIHDQIYEEIRKVGRDYYSLYNLTSREFFEKNRAFFMELVRRESKPVLLCFYPENVNYYWVLNIEYHIVDKEGRPREIGTIQMDTGNARRFGISYTDKDSSNRFPVILHTAIIGSIERWLYTLFDQALMQSPPALPVWLSPIQIRFAPVGEQFIEQASKLCTEVNSNNLRADIDDRPLTVSKKIREAEASWIPFVVLVGEKEVSAGTVSVRIRSSNQIVQMDLSELITRVANDSQGYPRRPLDLPRYVSQRPIFSA
jgi:threonyl-tRNA synthetase